MEKTTSLFDIRREVIYRDEGHVDEETMMLLAPVMKRLQERYTDALVRTYFTSNPAPLAAYEFRWEPAERIGPDPIDYRFYVWPISASQLYGTFIS